MTGFALEVVERAEQRSDDNCGDEQVEKDAEGVDLNAAAECGEDAEAKLIPTRETSGESTHDGEPAKRLAAGAGLEHRLDEHDKHGNSREDALRKKRDGRNGESDQRAPPGRVCVAAALAGSVG